MVQRAAVAPMDGVGVGVELVGVEGLDACQHVVAAAFGGEEGLEGFVVRGGGAAFVMAVMGPSSWLIGVQAVLLLQSRSL